MMRLMRSVASESWAGHCARQPVLGYSGEMASSAPDYSASLAATLLSSKGRLGVGVSAILVIDGLKSYRPFSSLSVYSRFLLCHLISLSMFFLVYYTDSLSSASRLISYTLEWATNFSNVIGYQF